MPPKVFCYFKRNQQSNKAVDPSSDTGGTATIATNIKPSTVSKPESVSSSPAIGPLNVKCDSDESYCDLIMEPPPIKRCRISNSATADAV